MLSKLKHHTALFITPLVLVLLPAIATASDCENSIAIAISVQGTIEEKRENLWTPVKRNDTFCAGDIVRVRKNSRAIVRLIKEQTNITLAQHSTISFSEQKEKNSTWLELLKGAANFISRVPQALKIKTPYVNAAVEGTEFLITTEEGQSQISVFEGHVALSNEKGKLDLKSGDTGIAKAGQAPAQSIKVDQVDAVQWTMYYPPIISKPTVSKQKKALDEDFPPTLDNDDDPKLLTYYASQFLAVGSIDQAEQNIEKALSIDRSNSNALSLKSIIAIVKNDKESALKLAKQAVKDNQSAAAQIALSYAHQAHFDLDAALNAAKQATQTEPNNGIAWARLAELWLSIGELDKALSAAKKATKLSPGLAHTQTILGFSYLTKLNTSKAKKTFEKAISLDQAAPLPHLGLGLAIIREGDLEKGRIEIEAATSLDPRNSLLRSYVGKAYYEEKRNKLAADQFALAKQLDPKDPTPWFYDAIRKYVENDPIGALEDLDKSVELNNNRAVYRSNLQLDQDEATRNASASRIYQELGYDQLAINQASKSISQDPTNYSAHELLADSYLSKPRHEIARVSETLQAKILNPLKTSPQQAQLTQGSLTLLNNLGPYRSANNEYNQLFQRNHVALSVNTLFAGKNTEGAEGVLSGVKDWFAFSFSKYTYETDGFHANNGQDQTLSNYFLQARVSDSVSVFFEREENDEILGDQLRFFADNFSSTLSTDTAQQGNRVGINYRINSSHTILGMYLKHDQQFTRTQSFGALGNLLNNSDIDDDVREIRYLYNRKNLNFTLGYSETNFDETKTALFNRAPPAPPSPPPLPNLNTIKDSKAYFYTDIALPQSIDLTLGYAKETYKDKVRNLDIEENNSKLGISWSPILKLNFRLAYIESLRKTDPGSTTIEPTMISGFNQFYDDTPGTESEQIASTVSYKMTDSIDIGLEHIDRDLNVPRSELNNTIYLSMSEKTTTAYANLAIYKWIALNIKAQKEKFIRGAFSGNQTFEEVETHRFPIGLNVYYNKFKANLTTSYYKQEGTFIDTASNAAIPGKDDFWNVDLNISYLFSNRIGSITLGVKNLAGKDFNYEETDRKNPTLAPERIGFVRVNLSF